MRTTIDIPDELLLRAKAVAARRQTTLRELIIEGLEAVLNSNRSGNFPHDALQRLRKGLHFTGNFLKREEIYDRCAKPRPRNPP